MAREGVAGALKSCRGKAKKAGDGGAVLARFASTGIVMIGAQSAGVGDIENGLKLWGEGEQLVQEDRPGFQFGLKSFQG